MSDDVATTEFHIAGIDIHCGHQLRQRCAWCGAVLIDMDLSRVAVPIEDADSPMPTWPPMALIGRSGGATWVQEYEQGTVLPDGCCAKLDPEVTR